MQGHKVHEWSANIYFLLKPISRMKEAPWIFAHYIKKSTNFAQSL